MKKIFLLFPAFLLCFCINTYAKTGDVTGGIYETDISCFINGKEVPGYNIGGKTVIIVEDTTDEYCYNDGSRTLIVEGFDPDATRDTEINKSDNIALGKRIGDIYETDIKTYFRNTELPCYALNGKMAVAIEDIGGDNNFTKTGGKFIWDPEERKISLEVVFDNIGEIEDLLKEKHVNLNIDKEFNAVIESDPIMYGEVYAEAVPEDLPQKIKLNEELIGYLYYPGERYIFGTDEDGETTLQMQDGELCYYLYTENIKRALNDIEISEPTRADWLKYYKDQLMNIVDCIETEEYTFLYMYQSTSHGRSDSMRLVYNDGTVKNYDQEFKTDNVYGITKFENVEFDRENKKVTFVHGAKYEIDLETGVMKEISE